MKILTGQRGSGTTTAMLLEASHFENSLVVVCANTVSYYIQHALVNELDTSGITFISWKDFVSGRYDRNKHWRIFIDNVDVGIKNMTKGSHIETMTIGMEQMWNSERGSL